LLVFRRTRAAIRGDAVRRTHTVRVRTTAVERKMHDALDAYRRAVEAEHGERALALSVLDKRAYSSAWSLMQSVSRRTASLVESPQERDIQLALPLGDPDGEQQGEDEAPAWPIGLDLLDPIRERRLLSGLLALARAAVRLGESKIRVLKRLLRRVNEPALI